MQWDDYKVFAALAQQGSVRAAAKALGVNASTVSRRLEQLEARLGVSLFRRGSRGIQITGVGEEVADHLARISREFADIEERLRRDDQRLSAPIRLALPDVFADSFVMSALTSFASNNPAIRLHLAEPVLTDGEAEQEALMARRLDVLICCTAKPSLDLVGHRLGSLAMAGYGAAGSDHVEGASWLGAAAGSPLRQVSEQMRVNAFEALQERHRMSDVHGLLAGARWGLGVTALPCLLAEPCDRLVRLGDVVQGPDIWLLTHPALRNSEPVQGVSQIIREVFSSQVEMPQGHVTIGT